MKYAVIGAGAMGSRYGLLLQERVGREVDFIDAWQPHIDAIRAQGGLYVSRDGENRHIVPMNVYTPEEYDGDPDVWIVFMKQMQLETMLKRCAHLFKEHQVVFSAMNGWGHFEHLQEYFSDDRIFGGTALVASVLNKPGDIDFIGKPGAGSMNMCAMNGERPQVMLDMFEDFNAARINPHITDDFKGTCMAKIVFNSVVNTLCTMFQIKMGEFIEHPSAEPVARQLIAEAYETFSRAGIHMINTPEEEWETIRYVSTTGNPLHYPSMYQDLTKGRQTEVDYINGYIARLGREHGYECTTHEFLTQCVHLAEHAYAIHHPELKLDR